MSNQHKLRAQVQTAIDGNMKALIDTGATRKTTYQWPYAIEYTFTPHRGRAQNRFPEALAQLVNTLKKEKIPYCLRLIINALDDATLAKSNYDWLCLYNAPRFTTGLWTTFTPTHNDVITYLLNTNLMPRYHTSRIYNVYRDAEEAKLKFLSHCKTMGEEAAHVAAFNELLGG